MSCIKTSNIRRLVFAFVVATTTIGCSSGSGIVSAPLNPAGSSSQGEIIGTDNRTTLTSQALGESTTPATAANPGFGPRVSVGPQASITCPSGSVNISPGTNVQSVVNSHAAGTKYCLAAGTFAQQQITPKAGDMYVGVKGATLDGRNASANAFIGRSSSVTVKNLVIANYRVTSSNDGAISVRWYGGTNWTIQNNEILNSSMVGVSVGSGTKVIANYIHNNQQSGYYCGGVGATFTDNEIANNNPNGAFNGTHTAGGGKCLTSTNVTLEYNYIHSNNGPGIWNDGNNQGTTIAYNDIENNGIGGILQEISWDAAIYNNIVENNESTKFCPSFNTWCTEIMISNSGGVNGKIINVYGNTVVSNVQRFGNGIILMNENRGSGTYGTYLVQNVHVHNNSINVSKGGANGAVTYNGDNGLFSSQGNNFNSDAYTGASGNVFYWSGTNGSFAFFQSKGEETSGTSH